jgi:hypothetical protein
MFIAIFAREVTNIMKYCVCIMFYVNLGKTGTATCETDLHLEKKLSFTKSLSGVFNLERAEFMSKMTYTPTIH